MSTWARTTGVGLALAVLTLGADPAGAEDNRRSIQRAYDLAYNLDHDQAIETLRAVLADHPDDPDAHRAMAALTWLRLLFLRGAVLLDAQHTGTVRPPREVLEPWRPLEELFDTHVERAIELSEEAVDRDENDPDAHFQLGASVALLASYRASIGGDILPALRDARRAYAAHQTVLELDPGRKDAQLILGIYRYLVSLLPRALRMMAYLVGFDGGREEAVRLIEEAAAYPGETQAEAAFALVMFYNREREYDKAQRTLYALKHRFPRNRLVWLESASTWLRDDRPHLADRDLALGLAKLRSDDRTRMRGEAEVWMLKRGAARVSLRRIGDARPDLERARDDSVLAWVRGRAHLELGKIADLAGNRERATEEYERGRRLCREVNDRRCVRAAEALKERGYPAP